MESSLAGERVAARCENCGNIFVSEICPDGSIRPIGTKQACSCGNGDFRPIERELSET